MYALVTLLEIRHSSCDGEVRVSDRWPAKPTLPEVPEPLPAERVAGRGGLHAVADGRVELHLAKVV